MTIVAAGVGEGEGAIVGLGVAAESVGDGAGATVDGTDGDAVGDGSLGVGVPEGGLGLVARPPHAATRTRIKSAMTGCRRTMRTSPEGFLHAQDRRPTVGAHLPLVTKSAADRPLDRRRLGRRSNLSGHVRSCGRR